MELESSRPLRATIVAVVIVAAILITGGLLVRSYVAHSFGLADEIRTAQYDSAQVVKLQLDEETGVRGFAATNDRVFMQPYDESRQTFAPTVAKLRTELAALGVNSALPTLADAVKTCAEWDTIVAKPLLSPHAIDAGIIEVHGKQLMDHFRLDMSIVNDRLDERAEAVRDDAAGSIDRVTIFIAISVLVTLLVAYLLASQQIALAQRLAAERARNEDQRRRTAELRAAYEAEKRIADSLQDAIAQRPLPLVPTLRFSATYVPATEETKVGGDWYDAIELPGNQVLFAIGDVAGHGIDAAVTMNRARQALSTSALLDSDPASVLERVNTELLRQKAPMVTAVAGFADARTYEFVYATAGHPPPVLLEPKRPPRLLDFGGLPLGVTGESHYTTYRIQTVPGAILVLYTDGAVEHSHDVIEGEAILLAAAAQVAEHPETDPASVIHNAIFAGRPAGDDVAILTVGFAQTPSSGLTISADNAQAGFTGRFGRIPPSEPVLNLADRGPVRRGIFRSPHIKIAS